MNESAFLRDFRETAAKATRGCVVLERPDLVRELVAKHGARDTTSAAPRWRSWTRCSRGTASTTRAGSPGRHWAYRFAKKHWFFGFGATPITSRRGVDESQWLSVMPIP